jgi:hypothetical protein
MEDVMQPERGPADIASAAVERCKKAHVAEGWLALNVACLSCIESAAQEQAQPELLSAVERRRRRWEDLCAAVQGYPRCSLVHGSNIANCRCALIAAYEREQAGEGWQPIETAPRQAGNGWNRFVVCKAGAGPRFVQIVDGFANLEAFTHWMPLPSPPTEEKGR